jgi:hypothetical protein
VQDFWKVLVETHRNRHRAQSLDGRVLDNRYYHNHYYWPHGYVVNAVPHAAVAVHFGGGPWYFHEGIWYRPYGGHFVVAAPPIGVVVPVLPPFYTTLWVHGAPYYYANDVYYTWNPDAHGYAVTNAPPENDVTMNQPPNAADPPPNSPDPSPNPPSNSDLFIYPKNGQSEQQQSTDRYECHSWANSQTHYDPTRPNGGVSANEAGSKRSDYFRAMTACLEGRGYTVK